MASGETDPFGFGGGGGGGGGGGQMSEYERQRLENIKEMHGQFSDIFDDVIKSAEVLAKSTRNFALKNVGPSGGKRRQKSIDYPDTKRTKSEPSSPIIIRRSSRIRLEKRKITDYNEGSDSDEENPSKKIRRGSLRIKFPWCKRNVATDEAYYNALGDDDFINDDDEDYTDNNYSKRTARRSTARIPRLAVSKVTEEILSNITYSSVGKIYSVNGTTCHQCRQKTLDQKSYCRYKHCRGARGMFCGFCLGNRYGENVAEVLVNEKWACPPCRGYCNCSICRRKNGRNPTGPLAPLASAKGFKSVRHMLNNLEGEDSEKNISNDFEIEDEENEQEKNSKGNSDKENGCKIKNSDVVVTDELSETTIKTGCLNKDTVNIKTSNEIVKAPLETNDVEQKELESCHSDEQYNSDNKKEAVETILNKIYKDLFLSTSKEVQ